MSREYRVLPECYGDTLMIDLLGYKNPNHQYGISKVAETMKVSFSNRLAVAVVDNDKKNQPKYFSEFQTLEEKDNLILKKHATANHYLIFLNPAFDSWVWNHALERGVDPAKFNIKNVKYFLRLTKNQNIHKNKDVKQFINALKQKNDSPLQTLDNWLKRYLGE